MAYNPELTDRVRHLLAHVPNVRERKMFGSIGFIINDRLCIGVGDHSDHIMMVRVGPQLYGEALKKPGATPAIMRGREYKGYVFLLTEAVKTDKSLAYWVELALDFNDSIKK